MIQQAQKSLKKLKYFNSRQDGIFGPKTQKAVLQYQYEMDLPITGVLDDITIKHLKRPCLALYTQNFAPFHYKTRRKGKADGPVPQIVKLACDKAGINCRIILKDSWKTAQEEVKNGTVDGMFLIAWNSKRAQWLHRSTAIIETEYGLFVRKEDSMPFNQVVQQPSVLAGYTVGVYGPSGTSGSLNKLKTAIGSRGVDFQINMTADDKPLFRKLSLSKGKYAVYSNRVVGEPIIKGLGLSNMRYAGPHRELSYYVGFSKRQVPLELVKKFNQAYFSLIDQGDVISIMANHNIPIPKNIKARNLPVAVKTNSKQRYSLQNTNGMHVVVDAETCLMWQQSGTSKYVSWPEAVTYVETLNREKYGGFEDWRLPTIDELSLLMEKEQQEKNRMHIHPIFDALQQSCWSINKEDMDIQFADYFDGALGTKNQGDTNFVRAVRGTSCKKL